MRRRTVGAIGIGYGLCVIFVSLGCDAPDAPPTTRSVTSSTSVGDSGSRGPSDLAALIPADAMLGYYGRPKPEPSATTTAPSGSPTVAGTNPLIDLIKDLAGQKLDAQAIVGLHLADGFSRMIVRPNALVMLSVKARPTEKSGKPRMDRLRLAAIARTDGRAEIFKQIIQAAVRDVTDAGVATLTTKEADGWRYQELRDSRLQEYDHICWGEIDDFFVATYGEDVWPEIAACAAGRKPSLETDEWLREARTADGRNASLEVFMNAARIRAELDPHVEDSASAFFNSWDAGGVERGYWALGMHGRAMYNIAHLQIKGRTYERRYAHPDFLEPAMKGLIPPDTNFAVYQLPVARFLNRFISGLVATRDPTTRAEVELTWARIQKKHNFDAQRDLLDHLGKKLVIHRFPMHPMKLPFMVTVLVEVTGDAQRVAQTMDVMCSAWQNALVADLEKGIVVPATLSQEYDGIWYLDFRVPLAGPAWIVTDRYLVASWSPHALRAYLNAAGDVVGTPIRASKRETGGGSE